jgi:hypothetical protein
MLPGFSFSWGGRRKSVQTARAKAKKLRLSTQLPVPPSAIASSRKECEQDDDRNRDAKQPEKNSSTHDVLLIVAEV